MATGTLALSILPLEGSRATYLTIAPPQAGGDSPIKLVLEVTMTNNVGEDLTVTAITFGFPGSSHDDWPMKAIHLAITPADESMSAAETAGRIARETVARWFNGQVDRDPSEDG